jgi:hypothetical protein
MFGFLALEIPLLFPVFVSLVAVIAATGATSLLALRAYSRIHGPQSREAVRSLTGIGFWLLLIIVGISIMVASPGAIPTGVATLAGGPA